MSYARDFDDIEQIAQGENHGRAMSDFEKMLECFGLSSDDWLMSSNSEKQHMRWNWKNVQKARKS